jgi:hypothetical protein
VAVRAITMLEGKVAGYSPLIGPYPLYQYGRGQSTDQFLVCTLSPSLFESDLGPNKTLISLSHFQSRRRLLPCQFHDPRSFVNCTTASSDSEEPTKAPPIGETTKPFVCRTCAAACCDCSLKFFYSPSISFTTSSRMRRRPVPR